MAKGNLNFIKWKQLKERRSRIPVNFQIKLGNLASNSFMHWVLIRTFINFPERF